MFNQQIWAEIVTDNSFQQATIHSNLESLTDTNYVIEQRTFNKKRLKNFAKQSEFVYDRPPPEPSWFQKLMAWLLGKVGEPTVKGLGWLLDILFKLRYLFLVVFVLYIISKLLKMNFSSLFFRRKKDKTNNIRSTILEENIHELDFGNLIKQAIEEKNYRKAVRLHYLQILKQLNTKALIDWAINKTNKDYLEELKGRSLKKDFWELTYLFDYVWYGEFPISETDFKSAQQKFASFSKKVHQKQSKSLIYER